MQQSDTTPLTTSDDLAPVATAEPTGYPVRGRLRRAVVGLLGALGGVVFIIVAFYGYLSFAEWRNPSGHVYIEVNGKRQYLEQPTEVVTPRPPKPTPGAPAANGSRGQAPLSATSSPPLVPGLTLPTSGITTSPQPTGSLPAISTPRVSMPQTPLPPLELVIPAIGVDVPVGLVDSQHLQRVKIAGWLFKTAFPATAGNMVLLGHVDGNGAIFERLHELQPGDEIRVVTATDVHIYVVDSSNVVADTAVEVLAPTTEPVVTLITCAGDWNPTSRSYNKRLVVRAHYAAVVSR